MEINCDNQCVIFTFLSYSNSWQGYCKFRGRFSIRSRCFCTPQHIPSSSSPSTMTHTLAPLSSPMFITTIVLRQNPNNFHFSIVILLSDSDAPVCRSFHVSDVFTSNLNRDQIILSFRGGLASVNTGENGQQ